MVDKCAFSDYTSSRKQGLWCSCDVNVCASTFTVKVSLFFGLGMAMDTLQLKRGITALADAASLPAAVTEALCPVTFPEPSAAVAPFSTDTPHAAFRRITGQILSQAPSAQIDASEFWRHALMTSGYAGYIAQKRCPSYVNTAYVAGLLHDIGKLALDLVVPKGYIQPLEAVHAQGAFVLEAESREMGLDHTLAGKWLVERWRLPEAIAETVWLHHHPVGVLDPALYPVPLIEVVALANTLAHARSASDERIIALASERAQRLNWTRKDVAALLAELIEARDAALTAKSVNPSPEISVSPEEAVQLRQQLERQKHLETVYQKLLEAQDVSSVLHIAGRALQEVFHVSAGSCFYHASTHQELEGVLWRQGSAELESFVSAFQTQEPTVQERLLGLLADIGHGQADTPALLEHGLVAVPMMADTQRVGQILCAGVSTHASDAASTLINALLPFARLCGKVLQRVASRTRTATQSEALAAAIWKEELAQNQRLRAERLQSVATLAAGAAHEINNPLAVISGRAQLLLTHTFTDDEIRALETIVHQSRRISKIVTDLMQFARPNAPKLEPIQVSHILHQVVATLRERLERAGIRIEEEYAEPLPRTALDRHQLQQAFLNFILNAEQAMADAPGLLSLRVRPSQDGKSVRVQISDSGHGIPAHMIDHIFEPFFTSRQDHENTGLGLSVCHGIIENHRGSITVHSVEGQGATFTITLPALAGEQPQHTEVKALAASDKTPSNTAPPAKQAPLPKKTAQVAASITQASQKPADTVLLLVNEETLREVLKESLRSRGYQTRSAEDPLEAMALLLSQPISLTLIDLDTPGLEQGQPLATLQERSPNTPIIALSGVDAAYTPQEIIDMGAQACLEKPFQIERLLHEIKQALRTRKVA